MMGLLLPGFGLDGECPVSRACSAGETGRFDLERLMKLILKGSLDRMQNAVDRYSLPIPGISVSTR